MKLARWAAASVPLFVFASVACGGAAEPQPEVELPPAFTENAGSNVSLAPKAITAARYAFATCEELMADPYVTKAKPVTADDKFVLDLVGAQPGAPVEGITIDIPQGSTLDEAHPLTVQPPNDYGVQNAADGATRFIHVSLRGAPDPVTKRFGSPIDAATVTLYSIPAQDGDRLTARLKLHFVDGHTLDVTLSAAAFTPPQHCLPG